MHAAYENPSKRVIAVDAADAYLMYKVAANANAKNCIETYND